MHIARCVKTTSERKISCACAAKISSSSVLQWILFSIFKCVNIIISKVAIFCSFQHFTWSHSVQAVVLSSFFWGYVILQIPAGELASRFGGKILITISISVNSLLSLAIPYGAAIVSIMFLIISYFLASKFSSKIRL